MPTIKTRSGFEKREPYPLNQITPKVIKSLAEQIVSLLATGHTDFSGDMFDRIFAKAIGGKALESPLGIADIVWGKCCWSAKTVKNKRPHAAQKVRLISGRNSPIYSAGITDPMADVQATGDAVLSIYNARIDEARKEYDDVRLLVCLRNMETREFTIFERAVYPLAINDYKWKVNKRSNLEAFKNGVHAFTWQPHGSQFTIVEAVPESAERFRIKQEPRRIKQKRILELTGFKADWIETCMFTE